MYEYNLGIRFQHIVHQSSQRTAIWFNNSDFISYVDLNRLANQIAGMLIDRGVGPSDVICLSGTKASSTFASIIACLKIGAVYSILDPDSPIERLRKILSTCKPKLLMAEKKLLTDLETVIDEFGAVPITKDDESLLRTIESYNDNDLSSARKVTGTDPAYIMYTSGSTGFPKGAVMTHGNVLNLIDWSRETYQIEPDDRLTNVNPMYFDNSVFDFYAALFNGACLVPFSKEEVSDPKLLVEKIDAAGCTLWFSVPSLLIFLQIMKATDGVWLRSIRRFVFGGEGYPKAKLKQLFDTYKVSSDFYNVYGPTECTCICSSYKLSDDDFSDLQELPPLGQIAENFSYLIIDNDGKRVPDGEFGELCLLGPNVGKGYYNNPERTAASFIKNPYNTSYTETMYKTGDLVRFEPVDGKLYIQGRKDHQIKHMGYRIELEEIEAALHCLDYVSEAVALHSIDNDLSRIIAVISLRKEVNDDQIRSDLRQIIPNYMIPSTFHREEMLPKNPNGKLDRRLLAEKYVSKNS